jgi:nicotinamide-nucleotide amidase
MTTAARRVARLLKAADWKVVFAESCTGGLVSGALTKIAGISSYHCGGVVVYRNETKQAYLGIPAALLESPGRSARGGGVDGARPGTEADGLLGDGPG